MTKERRRRILWQNPIGSVQQLVGTPLGAVIGWDVLRSVASTESEAFF